MLQNLYIKNYALIDKVNLLFGNGLTIITGETGAGKSILLGGLELIRGKRTQQGLLKDISAKSIVEATFILDNNHLKNSFDKNNLDYEQETIIRRELLPNGKSRAFVNDTPVRLEVLNDLTYQLLDIHSQHQTLELTQKSFQFDLLDAVSDNKILLKTYSAYFEKYQQIKKQLQELSVKLMYAEKELEYKKFQLEELQEIPFDNLNMEELEFQIKKMDNQEEINMTLSTMLQKIEDEDLGLLPRLIDIKNNLEKITDYDHKYKNWAQRIESLQWELQDIFEEVQQSLEENDFNPVEKEKIQKMYSVVNKLLIKHQVLQIQELIEVRDQLANEVHDLSTLKTQVNEAEHQLELVTQKLNNVAMDIRKKRQKAIPKLIQQTHQVLQKLSMQNTILKLEIQPVDEFLSNGKDKINFYISSDKGKSFGSVKKIASGGELSRLMLAIKTILSKYKKLPTIIFDEIDTGISGEVAQNMADVIQDLSQNMQVIVITHLPQIAVKGNKHFKVYKTNEKEVTTQVKVLTEEERIYEIAEMLEGKNPSESALQHAKYLLGF